MKKVMVFGTFDGIHKGHLNFLKQAEKYGDYLIVVVARDETVKRLKGKSPLQNEWERIRELKQCKVVDKIILGDKNNPYTVLKKVKPEIICLGYDQKFFVKNLYDEIKKSKLKTEIFRMRPYKPRQLHSSIINKHLKLNNN